MAAKGDPRRPKRGHRSDAGCVAGSGWPGRVLGVVLVLVLWWGVSAGGRAWAAGVESPAELFDAAARHYAQGRPAEAAAAYETLVTNGIVTPAVLYNQGNAWLQAGQVGRAIASYRRAGQLAPRDRDIAAGLEQARAQVAGAPAVSRTVSPARFRLSILTPNEWAWLGFGLVWVWFGLLAVRQWASRLREATRSLVWVVGVLATATVAAAGIAGWNDPRSEAVVIVPDAVVRFGPLEESQTAFTLPNGTEVRVVDRKDAWCQVRDRAGRQGWVPVGWVATLR